MICTSHIHGQVADLNDSTPKVFMIGQFEKEYEALIKSHSALLHTVYNNSIDEAYDIWTNFLVDIEEYASKNDLEIKGVKLWLNCFWDKNGKLKHIVFYPKPNSRHMDYEKVRHMLLGFINDVVPSKKYDIPYSHYGSAQFPVFARLYNPEEK